MRVTLSPIVLAACLTGMLAFLSGIASAAPATHTCVTTATLENWPPGSGAHVGGLFPNLTQEQRKRLDDDLAAFIRAGFPPEAAEALIDNLVIKCRSDQGLVASPQRLVCTLDVTGVAARIEDAHNSFKAALKKGGWDCDVAVR
jgi:hypothetical protein